MVHNGRPEPNLHIRFTLDFLSIFVVHSLLHVNASTVTRGLSYVGSSHILWPVTSSLVMSCPLSTHLNPFRIGFPPIVCMVSWANSTGSEVDGDDLDVDSQPPGNLGTPDYVMLMASRRH